MPAELTPKEGIMNKPVSISNALTQGADIINKAEGVGLLDPRLLYEAVIDLSSRGLITANCINMAAGILLENFGLPQYFFEHILQKDFTDQPPAVHCHKY